MLGALVCAVDMIHVFVLNMTYDVPVKLFSFHLLAMSLFLLTPDLRRLADLFWRNRAVEPRRELPLFQSRRANRIALAAQLVFGAWLLGMNAYGSWTGWHTYGGGGPKSLLYGIWDIEGFSVDGQDRPPLLTDRDRWRRAIFEAPARVTFQRLDDSFAGFGATIQENGKRLLLKKNDNTLKANFLVDRSGGDRLTLDGEMDGHPTHLQLHLVDRGKFRLTGPRFHWIQEYPLNR
jgi:hypothetical protein